ncbi:sodium- and chloride-dependent glycine transporter 1-like [Ruditapes philippinarum]|uniref:sodium- and chloride-dependent glycine transporter 1-like n=1 Tax=Ruditapes philippinarum TaxID=129788 RepID=UPI00295C23F0|nr:sodium- and chloride-dependent glycine transporter 1-like [Ruditapes philippinarum]
MVYGLAPAMPRAFLIPIIIFNVFGAIPIVYLEMIMGQYSQSGAIPVWNVCPLLKGVGYGTVISTFLFSIYYGVVICWMLFYFIHSFFPTLPWTTCNNEWNVQEAEVCIPRTGAAPSGTTSGKDTLLDNVTTMFTTSSSTAMSVVSNVTELKKSTSAEQFLRYKALDMTDGLDELGSINWPLLGCLAAIEVLCFLCIFKGVKLTGKVVYFTVLGPFVLLAIFLVRGAILPGAEIGIKYYLTPDLSKLTETKIWAEACMQVFVSVGPGFGGMITFASYNKFTNNCMRDAILVCLMDLLAGFSGGFVIFSVLGHVSHETGIDIKSFNQSGYGLGFIAYPEAANYLPPPQLWCALFFFMSIFLGIDSQFPNYEIVVTAIKDEFSKRLHGKTTQLTLIVIVLAFLLAIPQVTGGGYYLLTLLDWYAATFSVTIFALIELLVMAYVYGIKRVDANMREMTGKGVPLLFKIAWCVTTPLLLAVTLGFTVYTYEPPSYGSYEYEQWHIGLGWCIAAFSLAPIPIYVIYRLYKTPGTLFERLKINLRPNELWGPPEEIRNPEIIPQEKLWGPAFTGNDDIKTDTSKSPDKIDGLDNPSFQTKL